jgi:adenine specific DNA methylase Mod
VADNKLFYGDNLDVLRRYLRDESVDLIYLDPPFNSRQDYNVLFAEKDGTRSSSQITAFEDTWEWNLDAEHAYQEIVERGGRVSEAMQAFRTFLGHSDMMAYLAMMAPRVLWIIALNAAFPENRGEAMIAVPSCA